MPASSAWTATRSPGWDMVRKPAGRRRSALLTQPRRTRRRWTSGGAGGKIGKTKYAPSPRANKRGKTVSAKTYGILRGEFNTKYAGAGKGMTGKVSYRGRGYLLEADGDGSVIVLSSWKE